MGSLKKCISVLAGTLLLAESIILRKVKRTKVSQLILKTAHHKRQTFLKKNPLVHFLEEFH